MLKKRASREGLSLSELVNLALRQSFATEKRPRRPFRQKTRDLGRPAFDVAKANATAAGLEDEEILRRLVVRIVDTSVLLPAVSPSLPRHESARHALEAAINDERPVDLTWVVVNAFLRLTTRPGLFEHPLSIDEAWELVDAWLGHMNVRVVQETEEHPRLWSELLRSAGTGSELTTDAWIAAIALAHGATVLTLDSDFARFPGLRWESPR